MDHRAKIDYSYEEKKLRENNPSVKFAWIELKKVERAYEKYYKQVIKTEPITEYTEAKQSKLQELHIIKTEKFRNYSFVLKLARDY